MRKKQISRQGDLFQPEDHDFTQQRVRDLDILIARALKKRDFKSAKTLTAEQETLIQQLVDKGDSTETEKDK